MNTTLTSHYTKRERVFVFCILSPNSFLNFLIPFLFLVRYKTIEMSLEKKDQERLSKAFRKMKQLGFDAQAVKPVLKRLLKLYDDDLTFIEEGNYQNLVDAILEVTNEEDKLKIENGPAAESTSKKIQTGFSEGRGKKDNGYLRDEGHQAKKGPVDPTNKSNQSSRLAIGNKDSSIRDSLVHDITNGREEMPISLLKVSAKDVDPDFNYIRDSIVYQSAVIQSSLARVADDECCAGCKGNCLSSPLPCACARDTGGEFAYTREGLLTEKFLKECISSKKGDDNRKHFVYCQASCPLERIKNKKNPEKCKGHLVRKFIKECWAKCGCTMQCGNRVVQRGITRNIQVFPTNEGKGWGVRTLEKLPAGAFISEYSGEIVTNIELYERNKNRSKIDKHVYPVLLDADWGSEEFLDEEALCLDATHYGNVARFMNHRCFDGNMIEIPVQVETADRHYYHLAFFTTREVDALEELTWDYGLDFDDKNHPIDAFRCRCGSANCRDRKRKRRV